MTAGEPPARMPGDVVARLLALPRDRRARFLARLCAWEAYGLDRSWADWAHRGQLPPASDDWRVWLIRAGRGFGKTRAGAEWLSAEARATPGARLALVGATVDEVRAVMIEGRSGILAVARDHETVRYWSTAGVVEFAGGAVAHVYSAEAPEKLRGPEHHAASRAGAERDDAQ